MNTALSYILVEDNKIDELSLLEILLPNPNLKYITTAVRLSDAVSLIKYHRPELLFIDIELPDGSGIEWIKSQHGYNPIIVFITTHVDYALEAYEVNALDFLIKPVSEERVRLTLHKVEEYEILLSMARLQKIQLESECIVFKEGNNRIRLPIDEILYLQAMQDYTKIVTTHKNYLVNDTLVQFLSHYSHHKFIRFHRSYAALRKNIIMLKPDKVIGENFELPIGKTYRTEMGQLQL